MKEIVEYFDRSYIINLTDRVDRRREVVKEFARAGIAVPAENVRIYSATRPADKGGFKDIATRGCFTSHRSVLELARQDNLRNVLVFEDDVSFRKVGAAFEKEIIAQLSEQDWDLLFFGYLSPADDELTGPLTKWKNDILGAHCYAVNGRFIDTMIKYMNECELRPRDHPEGGPMVPDGAYNHVRYVIPNVTLLLSAPSLALQRNSRSDLTPHPIFDRMVWLRPMVDLARTWKHRLRTSNDNTKLRRRLHGSDK